MPTWLITGAAESPLAAESDHVVVVTPEIEQSWCHTASYTSAVAALAALSAEPTGWGVILAFLLFRLKWSVARTVLAAGTVGGVLYLVTT